MKRFFYGNVIVINDQPFMQLFSVSYNYYIISDSYREK